MGVLSIHKSDCHRWPKLAAMPQTLSFSMTFTLIFVITLLAGLIVKFWLASRQIKHIASHRNQVPENFENTISLQAHQKAADYTIAKTRWGIFETLVGACLLVAWTLLGGLNLLNQTWMSVLDHGMTQQVLLVASFLLLGSLIELPISLYQTFVLEQRFGFNKMTWGVWFSDVFKGLLLGAALGLPLVWGILWIMSESGSLWWFYAWLLLTAFQLFMMWIAPTFIMPMFNRFQPLDDESLKARVTSLLERCGFAVKGLFVMDGSKRSAHSNAFFTGFGASKRIVFFDTLLNQLNPQEMEAVLAHELGHFKHHHVLKRLLTSLLVSLVGFALLGWLSGQSWFYLGLGVVPNLVPPNDALALLLFVLATPVFGFFSSPVMARSSRRHEFEADAYAVKQTSGADLSKALIKLYQDNAATLTPDALYVKFYYSHPPASERLARLAQ
jgi:STE24 endopeptidase